MYINCSKCDHWYKRSGSVLGKCRCKSAPTWNQDTLYCVTCDHAKQIRVPMFLEIIAKVKA